MQKKKKNINKKITKTNYSTQRNIRRKPIKKKKKKLNKYKVYRNLFLLCLVIVIGFLIHGYFVQRAIAKQNAIVQANNAKIAAEKVKEDNEQKSDFFAKETKVMSDLQRFNSNVGLSINYPSSELNVYPDSLNAANALKNNFAEYSKYLTPQEESNISQFINNVVSANTNYINAVITYNKNISSNTPNMSLTKSQKANIQTNFNNLNSIISKNPNIFENK